MRHEGRGPLRRAATRTRPRASTKRRACKLDPDNKRYRMGLESMHQQKESMGYFMEQLAKHKANRKYEKAAPDALSQTWRTPPSSRVERRKEANYHQ